MVAAMVEVGLEVVGVRVAGFDAIAGGDAVAEAVNDGDGSLGSENGAWWSGVQIERAGERSEENEQAAIFGEHFVCHD